MQILRDNHRNLKWKFLVKSWFFNFKNENLQIDPAYRPSAQPQAYSGSGTSMRLSQIQQQKQDSDDDMASKK